MDPIKALISKAMDKTIFRKLLKYIEIIVTDEYEYPPEIIKIDDVTIATLGNISATIGRAKSKKSINVSALVASCLSGKVVLHYLAIMPKGKEKVLYIDTEQSKYHCHKVLKRILKLAELPINENPENLIFLSLRECTPDQRRNIISCAIDNDSHIGLVVIDGIRDLLRDINSPGESLDVIGDLMKWSSLYNIHVHTVLHTNKADDNSRGHIGTELNNKAESVLLVTKDPINGNISEVKPIHIRDKEFKPFAFCINQDALPENVDNYSSNTQRRQTLYTITAEMHRQVLDEVFSEGDITKYDILVNELQKAYADINFKRGKNKINDLIKYLSNKKVLEKLANGYHYNSDFDDFQLDE